MDIFFYNGLAGRILYSKDAKNWNVIYNGLTEILINVLFYQNEIMITGIDQFSSKTYLITSSDGVQWKRTDWITATMVYSHINQNYYGSYSGGFILYDPVDFHNYKTFSPSLPAKSSISSFSYGSNSIWVFSSNYFDMNTHKYFYFLTTGNQEKGWTNTGNSTFAPTVVQWMSNKFWGIDPYYIVISADGYNWHNGPLLPPSCTNLGFFNANEHAFISCSNHIYFYREDTEDFLITDLPNFSDQTALNFDYIDSLNIYIVTTLSSVAYSSYDGIHFEKTIMAFPEDPSFVVNHKIYSKVIYNENTDEFYAFGSWFGQFIPQSSNTGFVIAGKMN